MGFALLCSALLSQGRKASSPTRRVVVAVSSQLALADSLGECEALAILSEFSWCYSSYTVLINFALIWITWIVCGYGGSVECCGVRPYFFLIFSREFIPLFCWEGF